MRVVVSLLYLRPGRVGGSETYVRKLLDQLGRRKDIRLILVGEESTLATFEDLEGCSLEPVMRGSYSVAKRLFHENWTLAKIAHRVDADLVFFPANFGAPLLKSSVPQVVTVHDLQHRELPYNFSPFKRLARELLFRSTFARAAHIMPVSNYTRNGLIEGMGVNPLRATTVYEGTELEEASQWRCHEPEENYFLYPATSTPHKNHLTIIRALAHVRQRRLDCHLVLTGARTPHYARIEREVEALGLRERVHHRGFVSRPHLFALMSGARALLFPSAFEGFGLPILEAMTHGVPVLAANNSAVSEIAGKGAWLLPTYEVAQWAQAMGRILGDSDTRAELVSAGRANAKRFSWSNCASATVAVFSRVSRNSRQDVP